MSESSAASFANAFAAALSVGASAGASVGVADASSKDLPEPSSEEEAAEGEPGAVDAESTPDGQGAEGAADAQFRIENDLATAAASIAQTVFVPSQGAQLYRIGAFNLCQAWMNNIISQEEFAHQHERLLLLSKDLILAELFLVRSDSQTNSSENLESSLAALADFISELGGSGFLESGGGIPGDTSVATEPSKTKNDVVPPHE